MRTPGVVLLALWGTSAWAAPFTAGNILAMDEFDHILYEYTPAGARVQSITMQAATPAVSDQYWSDLTVSPDGNLQVYATGDPNPYLTTYNSTTRAWTHKTEARWNSGGGGIAAYGNAVFVTDSVDSSGTDVGGLLRFTLLAYTTQRFDAAISFKDVTLGLDGLLYGLVIAPTGQRSIRVYNPATMAYLRTVTLPAEADPSSIVVDAQGVILGVNTYKEVFRFRPDGRLIETVFTNFEYAELTNIAINAQGKIAIGTDEGLIILTDTTLSTFGTINVKLYAGLKVAWAKTAAMAVMGDLNGSGAVDAGDAVIALRLSGGLQTATASNKALGDVRPKPGANGAAYGDGQVALEDALAILQKAVDVSITLP